MAWERRERWLLLLLAALTLAVFWPVQRFSFLNFDDDVYVTGNPAVRAGLSWEGVRWAFTNTTSGHFHPLTWISHQLDVSAFGLEASAHHRTTLWLHLLAVCAAYLAWSLLLAQHPHRVLVAFTCAAVFALHPMRVESVAWVATRKDVLSGLLFFLALWAHAWQVHAPHPLRRTAVVILYLLALLAKPTVLPFPLLLLALDAWPLERLSRQTLWTRVKEKWPLWVLMVGFSAVAAFGQASVGAMPGLDALGVGERITQASAAFFAYLGRLFWPVQLSIFHPRHALGPGLGAGATLLFLLSVAAVCWRRVPRPVRVGWTWFVLLLLPVCGLVQIGGQFIADRWLYLPTTGLTAGLAAAGLPRLPSWARVSLVAATLVTLSALTAWQLPHYRDSQSVFRQALAVDEQNFMAHNNLGNALESTGDLAQAEQHYQRAVELNPTWPVALTNLGNMKAQRAEYAAAEQLYQRALTRSPAHAMAHYNLALALALQGRASEALPHYAQASTLRPFDAHAALGHGATLVALGQLEAGSLELARAVQLNPSAESLAHHGQALRLLGRTEEARAQLNQALSLNPTQPLARQELSLLR